MIRYRRPSGNSLGVYVALGGIPLIALTSLLAVFAVLSSIFVVLVGAGFEFLPFGVAAVLIQRLEVHSVRFLLREARGADGLG